MRRFEDELTRQRRSELNGNTLMSRFNTAWFTEAHFKDIPR
jgi:hypothetical protein